MRQGQEGTAHALRPWKHVIGFILSLLMTALALWFVLSLHWPTAVEMPAILALAVLQVLTQLFLFMHVTERIGTRSHVWALLFGLFVALVAVLGSMWIMTFKSIVS